MRANEYPVETCAYCGKKRPILATDHQQRPMCERCATAYAGSTQQGAELTEGAVSRLIGWLFGRGRRA